MQERTKKWIAGSALIAWMSVIFYLSSIEGRGGNYEPPLWYVLERKSAHVFEYLILSMLVMYFTSLYEQIKRKKRIWIASVLVFCIGYAISDEIHQLFVEGRSGRVFDVGVDTLGILAGIIFFQKYVQKKSSQ